MCARVVHEHRGRDVVVLDMRNLVDWVDFLVIGTGASRRQIATIADRVEDAMQTIGDRRIGIEGYHQGQWVVLDYGDVVIHVFNDEKRAYYQLEHLWADASHVEWQPAAQALP